MYIVLIILVTANGASDVIYASLYIKKIAP